MAHTNGLESHWAMFKRAIDGTFHHISVKHLPRYTMEFEGRHNARPRSLAGKPLAWFRATPTRRIAVLYGMVVYAIRFNNQLLHRQPTLRKRRLGENRGFRPSF